MIKKITHRYDLKMDDSNLNHPLYFISLSYFIFYNVISLQFYDILPHYLSNLLFRFSQVEYIYNCNSVSLYFERLLKFELPIIVI